ncbi:MAG: hypothetical protein PUA73_01225 [Bacilli bacterium]|nr:hypothetical protein [Bacilli bacterium]
MAKETAKKENLNKTKKENTKKGNINKAKKQNINKEKVKKSTKDKNITENKKTKQESINSKINKKDLKEKKETIKKAREQLYYTNESETTEITKLIKIVLIVTGIILIFYGVTTVVTKKATEAAKEKNSTKATIQYDNIMIGSMLNMDDTYYVLIEDENDKKIDEYKTSLQTISATEEAPRIYTANLEDSFNKVYLSSKENYTDNLEEFKCKGTILIKVSNHKIEQTYDTYDSISKKLNELE